ncbi:hypothetical protein Tcan_17381 [Toxocara canis]|uniref:Uncharacterized protein n=1 Tax=Toxocara canis TaxID=6265 RepID=A0A0B2UPG2_TOXCA|nr:hypothetical protein Tcan_17381 [Toxocara canis]
MRTKRYLIVVIVASHIATYSCQQDGLAGDLREFGRETGNLLGALSPPSLRKLESPQVFYPCFLSGDTSGFSSWCGDNKDPSEEPDVNNPQAINEGLRNAFVEHAEAVLNPDTYRSNSIPDSVMIPQNSLADNVGVPNGVGSLLNAEAAGNAQTDIQSRAGARIGGVSNQAFEEVANGATTAGDASLREGMLQISPGLEPIGMPPLIQNLLTPWSTLPGNPLIVQPIGATKSGPRLASAPLASAPADVASQQSSPTMYGVVMSPQLPSLAAMRTLLLTPAHKRIMSRLAHSRHRMTAA